MSLDLRGSELIKGIYSAGNDSTAWDKVAVNLLELLDCCAGVATLVDLQRLQLRSCRAYGPPGRNLAPAVEAYASKFREDPSLFWAAEHPEERFCDSRETLPDATYWDSPFVNWNQTTFGSRRWYLGFTAPAGDLTFCFAAHFAGEGAHLSPDVQANFRMIFDHVECGLRLGRRPFAHDSVRALLRLNANGDVQQLSRGAELLLSKGAVLVSGTGRLTTSNPVEQASLDRAIERALGSGGAPAQPTAVQIEHDYGRRWIIVIRPLADNYGPFGKVRRQAEVEIMDHVPAIRRLDLVRSLFDLTGRELQVLRLLAERHSIDSLSATAGISRNTTRAHLRSIFLKTRTNSQSELMQLCGGLCQVGVEESLEQMVE